MSCFIQASSCSNYYVNYNNILAVSNITILYALKDSFGRNFVVFFGCLSSIFQKIFKTTYRFNSLGIYSRLSALVRGYVSDDKVWLLINGKIRGFNYMFYVRCSYILG